jgi:hypothetical protein
LMQSHVSFDLISGSVSLPVLMHSFLFFSIVVLKSSGF